MKVCYRPQADIQRYLLQGVPKYVLTDNSRTASKQSETNP